MPDEQMNPNLLSTGATFANVAAACLALLGILIGAGALITASPWIALAVVAIYALLAAAFVLAGRWLRNGRRVGATVLVLLTLLLGFGAVRGDFEMVLPIIPAVGAALSGLRAWRSLTGLPSRGAA